MDRNNIAKIAQSPDDTVLLAKVWDKIQMGMRKNIPVNTGFLSQREQQMCHFLFGNQEQLTYFGGFPDAERKMLIYLPEYLDEEYLYGEESPVLCLRAEFFHGESPTHRDFLGALMGAGIARETVGDILVTSGSCDFLITAEIASYILQNFTDAGKTHLRLQKVPLDSIQIPVPETKEIRDTVSSLRLDSIIASGFRLGRSAAAQAISAGKVAVDGLPCEKPDKGVVEGVKISLRGQGKIILRTVSGQTKKGRISVVIDRFI